MVRCFILIAILSLRLEVLYAQQITKYLELHLLTTPTNSSLKQGDQFNLILSFENSLLTGIGTESIDVSSVGASIHLDFTFLNFLYDETDDIAVTSPKLHFFDGSLTGIHYRTVLDPEVYNANSFAIFYKDKSFEYSLDGSGEFAGYYTINDSISIPEPNTYLLVCCGVAVGICRRRRNNLIIHHRKRINGVR